MTPDSPLSVSYNICLMYDLNEIASAHEMQKTFLLIQCELNLKKKKLFTRHRIESMEEKKKKKTIGAEQRNDWTFSEYNYYMNWQQQYENEKKKIKILN